MKTINIPMGTMLRVYIHEGPWDQGVTALQKEGLSPCSAAQLAETRILSGRDSQLSTNGFWTSEAHIYHPNTEILAIKASDSPLLQHPEEATQAHQKREEFPLEQKLYAALRERASEDPSIALKSGILLLKRASENPEEIPVEALIEHPYTRFILEEQAAPYASFLKDAGITSVPLLTVSAEYASKQNSPFVRALWMWSLCGRSELYAYGGYILSGRGGRVAGVRLVPAKRARENLSE